MRDDFDRLIDILEAIEKIEKYSNTGRKEFSREELIQMWIIHQLTVIGEAASRLSPGFIEKPGYFLAKNSWDEKYFDSQLF